MFCKSIIALNLLWCDCEWSKLVGIGIRRGSVVEHGIGQHGREQQAQAARHTLTARETALWWPSND